MCRVAASGWEITLYPILFGNTRLCVGEPGAGTFERGWCFAAEHAAGALSCARTWDGVGDEPPGPWHRDLQRNVRRELSGDGRELRRWTER